MNPIRVLIVDDSDLVRNLLRSLIEAEPDFIVCGEAANGRVAVSQTIALQPDIITMDLQMPELDGMAAIQEIMALQATPILVLSDLADARNALTAVACGALEATSKPTLDDGPALAVRLRVLARIPVVRHLRGKIKSESQAEDSRKMRSLPHNCDIPKIIAIASSTGGPQALAQILPALPASFPCPIVIAQHIAPGFAAGMADWLNGLCSLKVTVANADEVLQLGRIYLADSRNHLVVTRDARMRFIPRSAGDLYRPSCDRLLISVADNFKHQAVGVILSGMGRDGVLGMLAIQRANGITISQDEATSLIFGMNREAIAAGAITLVLQLDKIAGQLCQLVRVAPISDFAR